MRKMYNKISIILIVALMLCPFNMVSFARELTDQEKAAFITRDEFTEWRQQFIATLSELDAQATTKILADMDFYDMQFKFTTTYTWNDGNNNSAWFIKWQSDHGETVTTEARFNEIVEELVIQEKIRRGIL